MRKCAQTGLTLAAALLAAAGAYADGPGAYRPIERPASKATAEQGAIDAYNAGYAAVQRADVLSQLSGAEADKHAAQQAYRTALTNFETAVRLDPHMQEAFTYLGYAHRKLGHYDAALTAYAQALRLNPDDPHAIEYQGEAFLGLNRISDARFNYLRLYAIAPPQASRLLMAMKHWTDAHAADTALASEARELAAWIAAQPAGSDSPSGW